MSSMYYIGTFKNNIVNKPTNITGTESKCLTDILDYCGIDRYYDFHSFSNEVGNLLFYKVEPKYKHLMKKDKYESIYKSEIEFDEFPVFVNKKYEESKTSYHIVKEDIMIPNYSKFNKINIEDDRLLNSILKDNSAWKSNCKNNDFIDDIKRIYSIICKWIESNDMIYWWQYY